MRGRVFVLRLLVVAAPGAAGTTVRLQLDQPEAALRILDAQAEGRAPAWDELWRSEGFRRLLARETAMGRGVGFKDALQQWLTQPETIARRDDSRRAVEQWREFDPGVPAAHAARYLPPQTALTATLYPVIKHTRNSFVFDLAGDPAIFLDIDPAQTMQHVEAIMTHELHHVGLSRCADADDLGQLSPAQRQALDWLGVFGEGLAVLATAGGPFRHPHYYSEPDEYLVWERDVARAAEDLERMEAFFVQVLDGALDEAEQRRRLFTFIATEDVPQGAAYTLGWKMAAIVERHHGHDALLGATCDPRELLRLYNEAAREAGLPRWSDEFLRRLYVAQG